MKTKRAVRAQRPTRQDPPAITRQTPIGGQRYGPYSVEESKQQLDSNVFTPEDFASCDDSRSWIRISAVPGIGPTVFTVEIDQAKNLLVIRYRGCAGASDVERCAEEVRVALPKMQSGFQLLADFTELESMDVTCVPHIGNIMELCDEKGVSAVVRIIPDPKRDIGLQIMSYFHYSGGVNIVTCENLSDATKILSQCEQQFSAEPEISELPLPDRLLESSC